MKLYKYKNYEQYKQIQTEGNIRKINAVWVDQKTIEQIAERVPCAQTVLCHGTRNAAEQQFFKKFLPNAEIIGTEISETASRFPMTEQWDFHDQRDDWIGKFDIVYSNSFDHSFDPRGALTTWVSQLSDKGRLFIEHSHDPACNVSRPLDPLELSVNELLELASNVGVHCTFSFDTVGWGGKYKARAYEFEKNTKP